MVSRSLIAKSEGRGEWMDFALRKLLDIAFPGANFHWGRNGSFTVVSFFAHQERIDRGDHRPYIVWSGENYNTYPWEWVRKKHLPLAVFHTSLTATDAFPGVPFFHLPFAIFRNPSLPSVREISGNDRPEFLAYVARNTVPIRDDTFRLFEATGKGAKAYGRCCNNVGGGVAPGGYENLTQLYSLHRFALVFENADEPGYVTEKIVNAYMAGCIPIYWGSGGHVKQMFNPASFVYLSDFSSAQEMVDYVVKLDGDTERLAAYQRAPVFTNNTPSEYFDFETPSPAIMRMASFLREHLPVS